MRQGMVRLSTVGGLLLWHSQGWAAGLGPLAPLATTLLSFTSLFYGLAAVAVVYGGGKTVLSLIGSADRRDVSDGLWVGLATLIGGAFMFLIIPAIATGGAAFAAVP